MSKGDGEVGRSSATVPTSFRGRRCTTSLKKLRGCASALLDEDG